MPIDPPRLPDQPPWLPPPPNGDVPGEPLLDPQLRALEARASAHRQRREVRPARPSRPARRHAAKGSRAAALAISVGTTIGLTTYFRLHDAESAATVPDSTTTVDPERSTSTATTVTTERTTEATTDATTATSEATAPETTE